MPQSGDRKSAVTKAFSVIRKKAAERLEGASSRTYSSPTKNSAAAAPTARPSTPSETAGTKQSADKEKPAGAEATTGTDTQSGESGTSVDKSQVDEAGAGGAQGTDSRPSGPKPRGGRGIDSATKVISRDQLPDPSTLDDLDDIDPSRAAPRPTTPTPQQLPQRVQRRRVRTARARTTSAQ